MYCIYSVLVLPSKMNMKDEYHKIHSWSHEN